MKILEDANEYINLQAWAQKTVEELGDAGAEKLRKAIDATIKRQGKAIDRAMKQQGGLPSGNLQAFDAFDMDKLEGMSFMLTFALNESRVKSYMAPGIDAMKKVEKVVIGGKHGGETSGKVRREKVKPTREAWQKEAEKIWQKHSTWSKKRVAEMIVKRIGGNINTIRKSIQKTLP